MASNITLSKAVYLYDEGVKGPSFKELKDFVKKTFGLPLKIINIKETAVHTKGLLFDPIKTRAACDKIMKDKNACHIILTERLFATCDEDKRPHIRAAIYGYPSIISTSGIVEGPAKPREYYLYKERLTALGTWPIEEPKVKRRLKARFIDYGDKRMTEVLKGYLSQATFFFITGEPFCAKRGCRLFNAHWQEDLIYAQIERGEFCTEHKVMLMGPFLKEPLLSAKERRTGS